MSDKIKKPAKGWAAVRRHLKAWDSSALLSLVKDLYESSPANRAFLDARIRADEGGEGALEPYRKRIVEQFFPARGEGKLQLGEARKALREYRKATGNTEGVIELLTTYLENGNEFTHQYGDIDERFYDSLCSAADELAKLLKGEGPSAYAKVRERLIAIATKASGIGWGYGDHIDGVVDDLEDELAGDETMG